MTHLTLADLEPHTHTWRRVRTWHQVGYWECARCYETGRIGVETEPAVVQVGGLILRDEPTWAASGSGCEQSGQAALAPAGVVAQAVHQVRVGPAQRQRGRSRSLGVTADVAAGETAPSSGARSSVAEHPVVNRGVGGSIPSERATTVSQRRAGAAARREARAQRNAVIAARVQAGENVDAIAAAVGMHRTHVYQIARRAIGKAAIPKNIETANRNAEIARRRAAGESPGSIAGAFGLHPSRIPQIVREVERVRAATAGATHG